MPARNPELRHSLAKVAAQSRWGGQDPGPRQDLATERLAAYIERVLEESPPLTDEQVIGCVVFFFGRRRDKGQPP